GAMPPRSCLVRSRPARPASTPKAVPLRVALLVLEHCAATYLFQILFGSLLVALGHDGLTGLTTDQRVVGRRLLLGADREHLHSVLGDFGRRQSANLDAVEHLAQLRRNVSRAADDLLAHGDVLEGAGKGNSIIATLKTAAQSFRLALASLDGCFRRSGRNEEKDGA